MQLSDKEMKAIIELANHKLSANDPDHKSNLFNEPYRVWSNENEDGWRVSLQNEWDVTCPVTVLNSEIESAIKFLDKLEHIKCSDPIVSKAFDMSPNDELHALRLAVVGLAKSVELLRNS